MSLPGRPLETLDFMDVLTRQLDRCAELATGFFRDTGTPAPSKARAFVGSVIVAYTMALPVLEEEGQRRGVAVGPLKRNLEVLRAYLSGSEPGRAVEVGLAALSELIRALHLTGLLFRTTQPLPTV